MTLTLVGVALIAIVGLWIFGGVFLRVAGIVFAFAGAISLITLGDPAALFMVVLGFAMWLAGHWHFALRHHEYKSPLARRIFLQVLPPRYDPTRHWGAPVVSDPIQDEQGKEATSPAPEDSRLP
jgi:hypothetical protein